MSQFPSLESSGAREDKKIFFKGLEKCLEAFTSGEGRVVRKYARLFSQLSGKRQEDEEEAISWSSSEEDSGNGQSVVQRSKITRKLNSQINFDNRIRAKEHGRRLTRAEFSRSGGHLLQDPLGLFSESAPPKKASVQKTQPKAENSESLLNAAMLLSESQDLMASPGTSCRDQSTSDFGITSPVFKLNSSYKKKVKRRPLKSNTDRVKPSSLSDSQPVNVSANRWEPDVQLTPEGKTGDENFGITSPILGRTAIRCHTIVTSPLRNNVGDPSVSPIMLKPVRRKRRHIATVTVPASPILEPKRKTFKRKRREFGFLKGTSQSPENRTHSSTLGIVKFPPSFSHSECPVKRSLDFEADAPNIKNTDVQADNSPEDKIHCLEESSKDMPSSLRNSFSESLKFQKEVASQGLLNATNQIEEVNSEELDLAMLPPAVFRRPNRLSLFIKKREVGHFTPDLETIEDSSQTQCVLRQESCVSGACASRASTKLQELKRIIPTPILDQTNLIEDVCTEELDLSMFAKPYLTDKDGISRGVERNLEGEELMDTVESSPTQGVQSSPSLLEKHVDPPPSKLASKSVKEVSEDLHREFNTKRATRSSDRELIISQSSSRSGVKSSQTRSPEIERTSSPIGRKSQETSGPYVGILPKCTRSPAVSSPLVISSAGSSPDMRNPDVPFVILEDEYNAPPKRRRKKLDPNGIASRLQRLLNQRRSTARIWQYKRSKLSRLNNKEEEEEESRGRLLQVFSVRTDYSHIVLLSKEVKGTDTNGKEFRDCILVVLDPGVVVRLAKIISASKIKIFPPWQSMDLVDHDITVVLGANIVEVVSTEQEAPLAPLSPRDVSNSSTAVQNYACRCLPPAPTDAVILECWDGVQSIGVMDLLFPLAASSSTQLVQCDGNTPPTLLGPDPGNSKRQQAKYSIKALLSTQSTASHGKGVVALTVLRVLCYRQRSFGLSTKTDTLLHWSVIGRDDSNEVCELILGQIQTPDSENRCDWTDFISGTSLGKKYKFRGVAVSQRLDRSRFCAKWDIMPEKQSIVYILAPSNQFSFSKEESATDFIDWEPEISTLAIHVGDGTQDICTNKPERVSFVCRIFHVNEHALYVADLSISPPQLCPVVIKQSTFIPPVVLASVQKPKPSRILVFLQDVEACKGKIVTDKYSRILVLEDSGRAYPLDSCQRHWPASPQLCSTLRGIKIQLPQFSLRSRTHNLVKLTGIVSDLDETSALMWPACGSCGSAVSTEAQNVHYCSQCSKGIKQLVVHMSLIVSVQCPDFPEDVLIRVKILHKTVQALLRSLPEEGQDISVREALGKPIGPIRCEVTACHSSNFVLNEVPSSLWM